MWNFGIFLRNSELQILLMMHIRCMEKNQASTARVYRLRIVKANHKRELIKGTETSYPDKIYIKAKFDL